MKTKKLKRMSYLSVITLTALIMAISVFMPLLTFRPAVYAAGTVTIEGAEAREDDGNLLPEGGMEQIIPGAIDKGWAVCDGISDRLYWQPQANAYIELSDDAYEGEHSLKIMNNPNNVEQDQRSLVVDAIPFADLGGYKAFEVSFMAKRVNNGVRLKVGPGWPDWNWGEKRELFADLDEFDDWVRISQIVPDNWVLSAPFQCFIKVDVADWMSADGGVLIDDLRIYPYKEMPEDKTNMLEDPGFEAWDWNGTAWNNTKWTATARSGFDGDWTPNQYKDKFCAWINDYSEGNPPQVSQNVTLTPDTAYNLSFFVKKFGMPGSFHEDDRLIFGITDGNSYTDEAEISPFDLAKGGFANYSKIGTILTTSDAAEYTFYFKHVTGDGLLKERGYHIDEVYLYEADPVLTSIEVSANNTNITLSGSATLTVTASYDNGTSGEIAATEYSAVSSNTGIVTVDGGVVTPVAIGTATITVTYEGKTDTIEITVGKQVVSISVTAAKTSIEVDGKTTLTVTATYDDGTTAAVTNYTAVSGSTGIATISGNTVTAVAAGTATITVTHEGKTNTVAITVTAKSNGCKNGAAAAAISVLLLAAVFVTKKII